MVGEFLMGNTLHWTGDLVRTRTHLEAGLVRYDARRHGSLADAYGQDIKVSALTYKGWTLWYQGLPDQALRCHDDAVQLATQMNHVHSIAYADGVRLFGLQLRGATKELLERGAKAIAFADERGVGFFAAFDRVLRAWALARLECSPDAIERMRQALDAYRATGAGRPQEALDEIVLAQTSVRSLHDRIWEPEALRLQGQCMLALPDPKQEPAQQCFSQAIALARSSGAKGWELRASTSLASQLCQRGQPGPAREILAPIFESFSEGFETADLRDARALLSELV
jgi:tetratricopeptide (TPR) repeat protein